MISIGIDPGITGAVAAVDKRGVLFLTDTPFVEMRVNKKIKKEYVAADMAKILSDCIVLSQGKVHVYIEQVHPMGKHKNKKGEMVSEGSVASFSFGKGYGIWIGALAALKIPYTFVTPQAWKKEMMQGIADKDAARPRAMQLFPNRSDMLSRKKDIGRADALLIAEYGRRQMDPLAYVVSGIAPSSKSSLIGLMPVRRR